MNVAYHHLHLKGLRTAKSTTIGRLPIKTPKQETVKPVVSRSTVTLEPAKKATTKKAGSSPRKVNKALLVKQTGEWSTATVVRSELMDQLTIVVKVSDASQKAFMTSLLRQANQLGSIVLNEHTYVCRNTEIHTKTEGNLASSDNLTAAQSTGRDYVRWCNAKHHS